MRYEVVEAGDDWIVMREGLELARFHSQGSALDDVAARLRGRVDTAAASLSVRYQRRGGST